MKKLWLYLLLLTLSVPVWADEHQDYLYYRDVNVPPYQSLREFFDMPNRAGTYQVTLVSDDVGPLTFTVRRVHDETETMVKQSRSYAVKDHDFQTTFSNPKGEDDLLVEIANSNPALSAKVSVIVVELPNP
jgi:hypothetical protein